MPDKWDKYAVAAPPPPDKWDKYAEPSGDTNPSQLPPDLAQDAWKAGVHAGMLDVTPGYAYQNSEEVDKQLRAVSPNYDDGKLDDSLMNDLKAGWENSVLGLSIRKKLPGQVRDPGLIDKAISGLAQMVGDVPAMFVGGAIGGAAGSEVPLIGNVIGAGAGAFAVPAAARQALIEGIQHGTVTSFSDLLHRMAHVTWAGTKGAVVGGATAYAGGLPVGGFIAKSGMASIAVKGLYQATAMETAGSLLDGRLPSAKDFASNAALLVPLNLITHGAAMRSGEANQALMDVYAKDGKAPADSAVSLAAQPPVKIDQPDGLRPAIQTEEGFVDGDTTENHAELAKRTLTQEPVSMEQLEADPALADDVLQAPQIHEQAVIDRAWTLKKEQVDAGEAEPPEDGEKPLTIEDLYDRASMKSGRGFVTPDGQFLSRMEARAWMKDNEPDVHEMWTSVVEGDKQAELDSEDYAEARNRVQARSVAEGDDVLAKVSPQNASRLAAARAGLNKIKAGLESSKYGREVLRTLFVGQRDARIAATTQVRDALAKLLPDFHDQEALSILRDYKHDPAKLAADLEEIRNGNSERQKALIPSIERAMNPSPELLEADKQLTAYYTAMRDEGQELGVLSSSIDPANYTPHIFNRIVEDEAPKGVSRPAMAKSSPFGKQRNYQTILDALKTGKIDAGTVNALDALSIRGESHAVVAATKILSRELANTELGKYGNEDEHPSGWVPMAANQKAFRSGADTLYVPQVVADALRPIIEPNVISSQPGIKAVKAMQGFTKSIELGLSIFHMKALSITAMNNMSFADFARSLASDTKSPEFAEAERQWAADGLRTTKTSTPYEAYQGLKESSIKESFDVRELPGIKQLDSIAKALTDETFDVIQRKFKVEDAERKIAAWRGNNPEATDEQYFAARRSIAKEVNSAYGGLNWEVMGWGKNAQELTRLVMLAPDWTFSNIMNLKYAGEGRPGGSAARMFWVKSFATGMALTQATSLAVTGQLSDHPTQVYLGKDKDGKKLYSNWFFAGAPKDAITLLGRVQKDGALSGLAEFITAKLGPIAGTIMGLATNKDATGRTISKKVGSHNRAGKEYTRADQYKDQAEFVAGKAVPFTAMNIGQMLLDGKNHTMLEYAGALAGSYSSSEKEPGGGGKKESVLPGAGKAAQGIKLPGAKKFSIRGAR